MSNTGPLGFESVYYITFFHFKDYYLIIAVHLPGTYCLPSTALIALNLPTYCPLTEFSNQPYEINAIVILFLQTGLLRYRDAMQPTGDVSRMPCEAGQLESVFLTLWQWPLGSYVLEPAGTLFFFFNVGLPLPWWSKNVAKNLPKQGDTGSNLGLGGFHYLRTPKPLLHNYWVHSRATMLHKRTHCN